MVYVVQVFVIDPFQPYVPFLYALKMPESLWDYRRFYGVQKWNVGLKQVNVQWEEYLTL